MELEDAFKKTWFTKSNPSDTIARACQTHQKDDGYIRKYIFKFKELKKILWGSECSNTHQHVHANTHCAVCNWYKELKKQELTWEQFLTEVTVINDEEA